MRKKKIIKKDSPTLTSRSRDCPSTYCSRSKIVVITVEDLPANILREHIIFRVNKDHGEEELPKLKDAVTKFEKDYITHVLERTSSLQECANQLGVSISTLVRKKREIK